MTFSLVGRCDRTGAVGAVIASASMAVAARCAAARAGAGAVCSQSTTDPRLREALLEAMASGVPVVTSRIAPFTEYLGDDDVMWCDPFNPAAIAEAMSASLDARCRERLVARGLRVAKRHNWRTTAQAHLAVYDRLREAVHA